MIAIIVLINKNQVFNRNCKNKKCNVKSAKNKLILTHILTSILKLKVAAYIKNTACLDFAKRKTYFYNFQ